MKKKKSISKNMEVLDKEDIDDIMNMSKEDIADARNELRRENEHSQAEALAKRLFKMPLPERADVLRKLRREDVVLFETIEYLLEKFEIR